jgi:hypothetical protein
VFDEIDALGFELCGWDKKHTPGAKAPCLRPFERPKAEALGYLEARTNSSDTT